MACVFAKCIMANEYEFRCKDCYHYIYPSTERRSNKCQLEKLKAGISTEQKVKYIRHVKRQKNKVEQ